MIWPLLLLVQVSAAPPPMPAFLAGCWEDRRPDGRWTEECWTSHRGGVMIGSGRTGKGESVRHWEWMRIERNASGAPVFYGSPEGTPAVAFVATEADSTSITFTNAAHDFPQRVRYTRTETGIDAEVSLADGSRPQRWSYRRPASNR